MSDPAKRGKVRLGDFFPVTPGGLAEPVGEGWPVVMK